MFFRAGSANNARNVNTDGTLNRNNAYNGNNGLRPRFDGSPDLLTARRRTANTVPHHPRKAYPSRSRGRLTGPVMGKHKTADAPRRRTQSVAGAIHGGETFQWRIS